MTSHTLTLPAARPAVPRRRRTARRLTLTAITLFTAWHIFASFLWIAPGSQIRALLPDGMLQSYMLPFFGQSWSVFAPDPINGNYHLIVRAEVNDGDGLVATEWVNATDAELTMSRHNLFPPRAASLAVQQSSNFKTAFDALNDDQKTVVGYGFYEGDDASKRLAEAIELVSSDDGVTSRYLDAETATLAYATQVAHAMWGDRVVHVQFQAIRQNIIPFGQRNDANAQLPAPQTITPGWRAPLTVGGQDEGHFEEIFLPAHEKANVR